MDKGQPLKEGPDIASGPPSAEVAEKPPTFPVPGKNPAPSADSEAAVKATEAQAYKGERLDISPGPMTSELGRPSHVDKYTSALSGAAGYGKSDPNVTERGQEPYIH
ncbi:hypothetical protein DUNSADRAFT_10737 [Dunaliella salina]|uniref:Encoded protein n=1 Tax=Dunaliella salina TaxID=3046 RepID=A0ABQ7GEP2_DUNSA|nr:hypothetical protein DUNSADRAFT_10737 [Dunaliella salina]|eukprot:KAF5833073.1 hypothetical protein DUNSADRAFT_10737 [Dunaliella salina]